MPRRDPYALRSLDVPVALRLAEKPDAKFAELGADLGISASTAHAAVRRLQYAGLLRPDSRRVNWLLLREFLGHGLRYVFPARLGELVRGVPTAHAAPPLKHHIVAEDVVVWAKAGGPARGYAIPPLYPQAVGLAERQPSLYELVALADAIRIGGTRERRRALAEIEARVRHPAPAA